MTNAEEYFIELTKKIDDVKLGKMFGSLCLKTSNGKSAAMFWKDNIVVKLNGDSLQEALSLAGTQPFEPMAGKPMKEWVQIPFDYKDKWKELASISANNVRSLQAKVSKKKK
ncbi:MAG TPA: hypothetical protein VF487_15750 [Chitinophagaceae bacterium]